MCRVPFHWESSSFESSSVEEVRVFLRGLGRRRGKSGVGEGRGDDDEDVDGS